MCTNMHVNWLSILIVHVQFFKQTVIQLKNAKHMFLGFMVWER